MREIKFRGRSCDKWLYGSLHVNESGQPAISTPAHFVFHCVAPETLGQYTGLKDSEGREIYEGDIVELAPPAWTNKPVLISWEKAAFMVDQDAYLGARDLSRVKVIGNIHDNPELLMEAPK